MGRLSNIKVFATDFDNTIAIHDKSKLPAIKSTWRAIHRALGSEDKSRQLFFDYHNGLFDLLEWCRRDFEILKSANLTESQFREIFIKDLDITPGAKKLFDTLSSRGVKTAVISGGLENTYQIFAEKFGFQCNYPRMAHRFIFDSTGNLSKGVFSNFDYGGKVDALEEICKLNNATLDQCAFVGDEINDIPIFKKVGLPIAINSENKELLAYAKIVIENGDLTPLLKEI